MKQIRSEILRDSAGHTEAECCMRIPGVCQGRRAGNVLCHVRMDCAGAGMKPPDLVAMFGCCACHDVFDGRVAGLERGSLDWWRIAARGMAETILWWHRHRFLIIQQGDP